VASIVKKCRHGRSEWEQCRCQWYVRERIGGRDIYTAAGVDHALKGRGDPQGSLLGQNRASRC
jgi:hypothetical protein